MKERLLNVLKYIASFFPRNVKKWHRWFAWRPINLDKDYGESDWVWGRVLWRRKISILPGQSEYDDWLYSRHERKNTIAWDVKRSETCTGIICDECSWIILSGDLANSLTEDDLKDTDIVICNYCGKRIQ